MARQQGWFALILALAIAAVSVIGSFPLELGLDLKGGSQLTLEVQPAGEIKKVVVKFIYEAPKGDSDFEELSGFIFLLDSETKEEVSRVPFLGQGCFIVV